MSFRKGDCEADEPAPLKMLTQCDDTKLLSRYLAYNKKLREAVDGAFGMSSGADPVRLELGCETLPTIAMQKSSAMNIRQINQSFKHHVSKNPNQASKAIGFPYSPNTTLSTMDSQLYGSGKNV